MDLEIRPNDSARLMSVYLDGKLILTTSENLLPLLAEKLVEMGFDQDEYELEGKSLRDHRRHLKDRSPRQKSWGIFNYGKIGWSR